MSSFPSFDFLPDTLSGGTASGPLVLIAALLLIGYAAGELMTRLRLPRLTGYIVVGLLLGDSGLGIVDEEVRETMRLFIDVGLGLLLFELGQRLDLQWMRRERWLWVISIGEISLTWLLGFTALKLFSFSHVDAAFLAALIVSTSPVVVMYMAREEGADGQVTSRVLTLSALNSLAAFVLAAAMLPMMRYERDGGGLAAIGQLVMHPAYVLAGSFALGLLVFVLFRSLARWFGKGEAPQFMLAMSMVVLAVGLADAFKLSVLCIMLTLGVLAKNADPSRRIRHIEFGVASELFCVILFIGAGATARFSFDPATLYAAIVLIAARMIGKILPVYGLAALTPLGLSRAGLVGIALAPLSGFTALLVVDPASIGHPGTARLLAVFLAAVAMLELVTPLLVQFAFRRAKESHPPE